MHAGTVMNLLIFDIWKRRKPSKAIHCFTKQHAIQFPQTKKVPLNSALWMKSNSNGDAKCVRVEWVSAVCAWYWRRKNSSASHMSKSFLITIRLPIFLSVCLAKTCQLFYIDFAHRQYVCLFYINQLSDNKISVNTGSLHWNWSELNWMQSLVLSVKRRK